MSHKAGKRSKKFVEGNGGAFKQPGEASKPDVQDKDESGLKGFSQSEIKATKSPNESPVPKSSKRTRSRSNTPLNKSNEQKTVSIEESSTTTTTVIVEESSMEPEFGETPELFETEIIAVAVQSNGSASEDTDLSSSKLSEFEVVSDMDPLVIEQEEVILELQFEDSEQEVESEGSTSRCRTRRSVAQSSSVSTTPRISQNGTAKDEEVSVGESENVDLEVPVVENGRHDDANESESISSASTDNVSTKATLGSDSTRNADFTCPDSSLFEDNSFLNTSKDQPVGQTLRGLSSRRTIRPLSAHDYRKQAMTKNFDRKDLNLSYASRSTIETFGTKRKRSSTPDEAKRMKTEHSGLFSYISEPLQSIKNRLIRSSPTSSTPKLTAYAEKRDFFDEDVSKIGLEVESAEQKKWCSVM